MADRKCPVARPRGERGLKPPEKLNTISTLLVARLGERGLKPVSITLFISLSVAPSRERGLKQEAAVTLLENHTSLTPRGERGLKLRSLRLTVLVRSPSRGAWIETLAGRLGNRYRASPLAGSVD